MKNPVVLQDLILNTLRKEHIPVTIHITNGFQIRGMIQGFDNFVVIVDSDGKQMMIYKHAISSVTPLRPLQLNTLSDVGNEE